MLITRRELFWVENRHRSKRTIDSVLNLDSVAFAEPPCAIHDLRIIVDAPDNFLGFTFTEWTEVYFAVNSSSNRNTRDQGARQDPPTVFALGDMQFGVKGAYGFKDGGVRLGGQLGLGLIAGSERLRTDQVNFDIAAILGVDLRYLTDKEIPVRFTGNIGWTLDNSPKLIDDWSAIEDPLSREVLRFSSGVNHSRVTTKVAIDFPIRLGKSKQYGIDPVIEYNWDIATYQEEAFIELTEDFGGSPLPRSQAWLTLGLRANIYDGLFLNAAVDVGTTSPSYEFGPPVPPYQVLLGLGWSFDPKPRVKQVAVPVEPDTIDQPVLEGRILGRVADLEGNPITDAKVVLGKALFWDEQLKLFAVAGASKHLVMVRDSDTKVVNEATIVRCE